jgi:HSP20 family molecular chaperone IbpA
MAIVRWEPFRDLLSLQDRMNRSFTLPSVVDQGSIKAEYKDGVLKLTLPKREEAKPRQIQINVS